MAAKCSSQGISCATGDDTTDRQAVCAGRVSNTAVEELDESAISALINFFQTLDRLGFEGEKQWLSNVAMALLIFDRKGRNEESAYLDLLSPLAYAMGCMKLPEEIREMFRRQGKIGGKKRLDVIPAERRRQIARNAAEARWNKLARKKRPGSSRKEKEPT